MRRLAPLVPIFLIATAVVPERPVAEEPAPRLVLIIDDFGYTYGAVAKAFLEMDAELTISVLPGEVFSRRIAKEVRARGKDLLLHLPMEPLEYPEKDPGPRAISVGQTDDEIRAEVRDALGSIDSPDGVSNHMGSRAMQDERVLRIVLEEVKERGLFFLDSKTVAGRLPRTIARSMGVKCLENDLFWDTGYDAPDEIRKKLDRLVEIARRRGYAIGIGHPRPVTLEALQEKIPEWRELGIRLVSIGDIVGDPAGAAGRTPPAAREQAGAAATPAR
jgi:hypothetical protein